MNVFELVAMNEIRSARTYNAVFNDYAEYFPKKFMYETKPGDIIALDESGDDEIYVLATEKHKVIVGVHSDDYGHLIGGENPPPDYTYIDWNKDKFIPIGLAGRVRVKFTGVAKKGMKVVPSAVPGIGREFNPEIDSEDSIIGYLVENNSKSTVKRVKMKIK